MIPTYSTSQCPVCPFDDDMPPIFRHTNALDGMNNDGLKFAVLDLLQPFAGVTQYVTEHRVDFIRDYEGLLWLLGHAAAPYRLISFTD